MSRPLVVRFGLVPLRMARAGWLGIRAFTARQYLLLQGVQIGRNLQMWSLPHCRCYDGATLRIGDDVTIRNKIHENAAGITHPCVLVSLPGARLEIGNRVGLSGAIVYCSMQVIIEDYANLGAGVKIYDTDFHPVDYLARRRDDESAVNRAPVRICQDVWVGADAIILKGVTVGARSVVAAGAVVTKDVPPDTIVAGVPARVVGHSNKAVEPRPAVAR